MKNTRYMAAGFALAGLFALMITLMINRQFGISQGATEEGRTLLSAASIVIDVAGLVLFGLAAGALFARGKKLAASMALFVMLASALYSMMSVISFVASEQRGLSYARAAQEKAIAARERAQLDAAKEQRDTQAKMAEGHLKWLEGTVKNADGRRERKEMMAAAKDVIQGVVKSDNLPKFDGPVVVVPMSRPDEGNEMMGEFANISPATVQLTRMLYLAILLITIKGFSFPLTAFFWQSPPVADRRRGAIDLEPVSAVDLKPVEAKVAIVDKSAPVPTVKALPAPEKAKPEPIAEGRTLLDAIGFPRTRMKGTLQPKEDPRRAALRFLGWLAAHNLAGEYSADAFDDVFRQFSNADHREEAALRLVKPELESLGRFISKAAPVAGKKPTTWTVKDQPIAKVRALLEKEKVIVAATGPKQEEATPGKILPFSEGAGGAPEKAATSQSILSANALLKRLAAMKSVDDAHDVPELARVAKHGWYSRVVGKNRKQTNRMRLTRVA